MPSLNLSNMGLISCYKILFFTCIINFIKWRSKGEEQGHNDSVSTPVNIFFPLIYVYFTLNKRKIYNLNLGGKKMAQYFMHLNPPASSCFKICECVFEHIFCRGKGGCDSIEFQLNIISALLFIK